MKLIETIAFENGRYPLLSLHQARVDRAFNALFPNEKPHDLSIVLPELDFSEKRKVRMVYDEQTADVEYALHAPRKVETIRLIQDDEIDYAHKFEDRSELERLFNLRGDSDEILIVKNGMITDSFYANPVFWDGSGWCVSKECLLPGVMRRFLLEKGLAKLSEIGVADLESFEKVSLVNALNPLGEVEVSIAQIIRE